MLWAQLKHQFKLRFSKTYQNQTLLIEAIRTENYHLARGLVVAGLYLNFEDPYGDTPLNHALLTCQPDMIKLLVLNGANIRTPDSQGRTPLDIASTKSDTISLNFLYKENLKLPQFDTKLQEIAKAHGLEIPSDQPADALKAQEPTPAPNPPETEKPPTKKRKPKNKYKKPINIDTTSDTDSVKFISLSTWHHSKDSLYYKTATKNTDAVIAHLKSKPLPIKYDEILKVAVELYVQSTSYLFTHFTDFILNEKQADIYKPWHEAFVYAFTYYSFKKKRFIYYWTKLNGRYNEDRTTDLSKILNRIHFDLKYDEIKMFLELGAKPPLFLENNNTPIAEAFLENNDDLVILYLEHGASLKTPIFIYKNSNSIITTDDFGDVMYIELQEPIPQRDIVSTYTLEQAIYRFGSDRLIDYIRGLKAGGN